MNKGQFIGCLPPLLQDNRVETFYRRNGSCAASAGSLTSFSRRQLQFCCTRPSLPAAGYRNGTSINNVGAEGNYWSTTSSSATNAYNVNFNGSNFNSANSNNRFYGFSVRLASVVSALALGSVILPAAGYRSGTSINNVGAQGNYWSTTSASETNAYNVNFNGSWFNSANSNNRYNGFSVRLASVVSALALGSVILPAAGYRNGTSIVNAGSEGFYWSTTSSSATNAYYVNFNGSNFNSANTWNGRCLGNSVRLASVVSALTLGSVILPAAGYRNGTSIGGVGTDGNYWSTTSSSETNAYNVNFNGSNFNSANSNSRCIGRSVRLASVVSALALAS